MTLKVSADRERIAVFCRQRHIQRLALFGSVLRPDFGPASDIDVLVEFEPDHAPGLFSIAAMERELSALFGGRNVDLRTPEDLSRYFRQRVLEEAEVQYDINREILWQTVRRDLPPLVATLEHVLGGEG